MIISNNNKYIRVITNILFLFLALTILFGRSLTGVYIFNFRLGELMIGFGLLVSIVLLFTPHSRSFVNLNKLNFYVHKAILFQFILIVLLTETSFTSTYTYKSSSYIWTISFLYIGMFLTQGIKKNSWFIKVFPLLLPSLYVLSTIKFPQSVMDFFINYSDKFDFVKASDLLVIYVGTNYILRIYYKNSLKDLSYFLISSAVYLPYLLFKSKGAFFPAVLFIIFNLFFYFGVLKSEKIKSSLIILICIPVFLISSFHIYGNLNFTKEGMQDYQEIETLRPIVIQQSLGGLINEKNTGEIFYSFYILDGRLYSQDQMADWRLQIWQDISRDIFWKAEYVQDDRYQLIRNQGERRNDIFYKGFGYSQILPAMNHWERTGTDGTNENPHNFLFNSLGRGGIFQPLLIIVFHLSIFLYWYRKNKNFHILLFMLPVLMTSFFDASMESVRFPFVYYSLLSLVLNEKI